MANRTTPDDEPRSSLHRPRGRPSSAAAAAHKKARERALHTGLLPHEILLSISRGEPQKIVEVDPKSGKPTGDVRWVAVQSLDEIRASAQAAAPYFAARISTVELLNGVSDDDLYEFAKRAAASAGLSLSHGGDSEEGAAETDDPRSSAPQPDGRARGRSSFA